MSTQLLTVPEVAARLQLSRTHTYLLIERGDIATVRIGRAVRITEKALADFVEVRTNPARPSMRLRRTG